MASSSVLLCQSRCNSEDLGCSDLQHGPWHEDTDTYPSHLEEAVGLTTNLNQPDKAAGWGSAQEPSSSCCSCFSWGCCRQLGLVLIAVLAALTIAEAIVAVQVAYPLIEKRSSWRQGLSSCGPSASQEAGGGDAGCGELGSEQGAGSRPWAPPNLTESLAFPGGCLNTPVEDNPLVVDMSLLNRRLDWKLVTFRSRESKDGQEVVELTAWWLPVDDKRAPRVVVFHGEDANFNDWTVQVVAYMLRSVGFAVLLPNFRDHGSSASSPSSGAAWGWDYPLDVLGAWDYAVNDPNGELGAKIDAAHVGLLGMSMGGFAVTIALGLEPFIPAAWLDSAPFDLKNELRRRISDKLGSWFFGALAPFAPSLAPYFEEVAWRFSGFAAGADLGFGSPKEAVREAGTPRRPVAVVHGLFDGIVPISESKALLAQIDRYPEYLEAEEVYFPASACGDEYHEVAHFWSPNVYRDKLCRFWTGVFDTPESACDAKVLPNLEGNTTTTTHTSTSTLSTTTTSTTIGIEFHSPLWDMLHSTTTSTTTSSSKTATSTTTTSQTATSSTTTTRTATSSTTTTATATSTPTKTATATSTSIASPGEEAES